MLCKYKLRKITVLFSDETANNKNPLSQDDEMCRGSSKYDILSNVTPFICLFFF